MTKQLELITKSFVRKAMQAIAVEYQIDFLRGRTRHQIAQEVIREACEEAKVPPSDAKILERMVLAEIQKSA